MIKFGIFINVKTNVTKKKFWFISFSLKKIISSTYDVINIKDKKINVNIRRDFKNSFNVYSIKILGVCFFDIFAFIF